MRLQGTNFQSWPEFNLDISGLTVIIGPSNKGKSAIFRALRGLFRNELPSEYIRAGSDGLKLTATLDDGQTIAAERSGKLSTKYQIGDKKFAKLNQTIPPELAAFGMNEVEVGDFTIDPIFARQNGKQFLVDPEGYSPMEINTILGAFASTEKLEAGKKAANLDITHKNSEAKTLAEEIVESKRREASLEEYAVAATVTDSALHALLPTVEKAEQKALWFRAAQQRHADLQPLKEALSKLSVPDATITVRLASAFDYAVQATNNFRLGRLYKRTAEATQDAYDSLRGTILTYNSLVHLNDFAAVAPVVAKLKDFSNLLKVILGYTDTRFADIKLISDRIILLSTIPELKKDVAITAALVKAAADEIDKANREIEYLSRDMVVCPSCGHKFDSAQHVACGDDLPEDYEVG